MTKGISEIRIHYGPGYRLYFMQNGFEIKFLLAGGDKSMQVNNIHLKNTGVKISLANTDIFKSF